MEGDWEGQMEKGLVGDGRMGDACWILQCYLLVGDILFINFLLLLLHYIFGCTALT